MTSLLVLGVVLGLDNMRVAIGLAAAGVSRATAIRLSVAFAAAETAMPFVGLLLGHSVSSMLGGAAKVIGGLCIGACGLYVLIGPDADDDTAHTSRGGAWVLFGLPIALSLDNLVAGVGLGVWDLPVVTSTLALGITSTLVCLTGFAVGGVLHRSLPDHARLIGGLTLLLVAAFSVFE